MFLQFWAVFAIFSIFAIWAVFHEEKYSNNCGAKKLHSNFSLFRAFLLKKGKILNNGKTQIYQFTHEGSILEQQEYAPVWGCAWNLKPFVTRYLEGIIFITNYFVSFQCFHNMSKELLALGGLTELSVIKLLLCDY